MSHTKAGGSTANVRDSRSQRLGIKLFAGQKVQAGAVIIRQRGTKYVPGKNVKRGKDDTLYAAYDGIIQFKKKKLKHFTGLMKRKTIVEVALQ